MTLFGYQMCLFQTLNDALRFCITTKLTLINTKIITETISIIVSQLQSKHTNYADLAIKAILPPPHWKKVGVKKFLLVPLAEFVVTRPKSDCRIETGTSNK